MGWGGPDNGYYKVNADTSTDFETSLGTYNMNFGKLQKFIVNKYNSFYKRKSLLLTSAL